MSLELSSCTCQLRTGRACERAVGARCRFRLREGPISEGRGGGERWAFFFLRPSSLPCFLLHFLLSSFLDSFPSFSPLSSVSSLRGFLLLLFLCLCVRVSFCALACWAFLSFQLAESLTMDDLALVLDELQILVAQMPATARRALLENSLLSRAVLHGLFLLEKSRGSRQELYLKVPRRARDATQTPRSISTATRS